MDSRVVAAAAVVVAVLIVGAFFVGTQQGAGITTTTTGTVTTASATSVSTSVTSGSSNGLQLQLSASASTSGPNHDVTFQIHVSEYNTMATANSITKGDAWLLKGLSLGPCGTVIYPFGVAIYRGSLTNSNASSAQALQTHPFVACPLLIRYITGYLFQPSSNLAVVLPAGSGANATAMSANLTAAAEFTSPGTQATPLAPGPYTIAAGDEWGSVVFLHFTVGTAGTIVTSSSSANGTPSNLVATFDIGPITPVCKANSTRGPAPGQYSSVQAIITPQPSGQSITLPIN